MTKTNDALAILGLMCVLKNKRRKKRNLWCKQWLLKKSEYSHTNLINELRITLKDYYLLEDE
jgi:hypothetical protein